MTLEVRPITLRDARRFVGEHHRHSAPPRGWLFGCQLVHRSEHTDPPETPAGGYAWSEWTVGVGIAGRPSGRGLQDGRTVEVTRVCVVDGYANACSRIYGALCRAAKALGYLRAVTYTEGDELGASCSAAGFTVVAAVDGARSWDTPSRRREDVNLLGEAPRAHVARQRWERAL